MGDTPTREPKQTIVRVTHIQDRVSLSLDGDIPHPPGASLSPAQAREVAGYLEEEADRAEERRAQRLKEALFRESLALVIRDWIHEQPWSLCNPSVDECPDWPKAFELADRLLARRALAGDDTET